MYDSGEIPPPPPDDEYQSPGNNFLTQNNIPTNDFQYSTNSNPPINNSNRADLSKDSLKKSNSIFDDLFTSEAEYIQTIGPVAAIYDSSFKNILPKMKKILSDYELASIQSTFAGLTLIFKCHSQFLNELELAKKSGIPGKIGLSLKSISVTIKVYSDYLSNLDNYIETLKKARKNKDFCKFLDECKSKSINTMDIENLCLFAFKRVNQYDGLFTELMNKINDINNPDYLHIKDGLQLVRKINSYILDLKSTMNSRNKIIEIQQRVSGLPPQMTLVAPHRIFIHQTNLEIRTLDSKKRKDVTAYAFNDMILITKTKGVLSKEFCLYIISYYDFKLIDSPTTENELNSFRMVDSKKATGFVLIFPNENNKNYWSNQIKNDLQSLKNSRATTIVNTELTEPITQTKLQVKIFTVVDINISIYEPYDMIVFISLGKVVKKSSVKFRSQFNPEWDETLIFELQNLNDRLYLDIRDNLTDSSIAEGVIDIKDLYDYVQLNSWFKLKSIKAGKDPKIYLGLVLGASF